jgi:hypothetical protein
MMAQDVWLCGALSHLVVPWFLKRPLIDWLKMRIK